MITSLWPFSYDAEIIKNVNFRFSILYTRKYNHIMEWFFYIGNQSN